MVTDVATGVFVVTAALLLVTVPFFGGVRRSRSGGVVMHLTTAEALRSITTDVPEGWVHLRPGRGWQQRLPMLGWPLRPFPRRVYFYAGERWPGWLRLQYNLPDPDRCTYAVLVDVDDLRAHGSGGRLYRRPIDRAAAWSGEYKGPGRIVERGTLEPSFWKAGRCADPDWCIAPLDDIADPGA